MTTTDPFRHDDAAYVLGALGPAERRAFEEHLEDCETCSASVRELAGLPGLLARVDETTAFQDRDDLPPVPDTLLPQLMHTVRRRRGRARLLAAAAVAAALVVAAVLVGVLAFGGASSDDGPPAARELTMTQVDQDVLSASVSLDEVAWGTRMHLECTYEGGGWGYGEPRSYALVVATTDGRREQVATWRAIPGRSVELDAASDAARDEIATVDVVVTGSGLRVLTLDLGDS
jgi:hypothetical protein